MATRSKWPDVEIPENLNWAQYVLQNFDKHADRTAITDSKAGRSYTYKQLKEHIHKFGSALAKKGFTKGDVFAIMCPNIPEYPIAYFGAILIGGTVTSMNPLYTANEIAHQLEHSGAKWVITVPPFADKAKEGAAKVNVDNVYVVGEADEFPSLSTLLDDDGEGFPSDVVVDPKEDIAALPYSSGTTGLPKGVMLTHYNLIADSCITIGESFTEFTCESSVLALLPFFHSYALMVNLANPLLVGGRVVCLQRFEPEVFLSVIQEEKITHAALVPPLMIFLAKHPLVEKYDLSSLSDVTVGAAAMGEELSKAVKERLHTLKSLRQGYGMTELSPVSHVMPLDSSYNPSSVGVLLPNLGCKIVDLASGEIVEQGKDGEICVRGPIVMKGYLNNPEATARTLDNEGWLHTGDIGHVDDQGYYYIVDRLKELIKYKGFQVPPAELEALLLTHPDVDDVAVIGIPDEEAGELPKAFIVRSNDLTADDITIFVSDKVAPYKKLRGGVEFIDKIPKSVSGKILRRELKARELESKPKLAAIIEKRDANVLTSKYPDVAIPEVTIPDYVMENFQKFGNVPAITDPKRERTYTYVQLIDLIKRCASGLMRVGLSKGDVLGIYSPNVPEFAIILLATLKAGGIITTANPLYTVEELTHQLQQAGAKYLFTVSPLLHRARDAAKAAGISTVYVVGDTDGCESFSKLLEDDGSCFKPVAIDTKQDVAVLPFSSGTTGLPKGVMLTHYNIVADASILCADGFVDYGQTSVILGFMPFFHSYGMSTMFTGLRRGCKLVCMARFDKEQFLYTLQDHHVSHTLVVPPVALMLAKDPAVDNYDLSSLVEITSGAASLGQEVSQAVFDRLPLLSHMRQGYGMTELSPVCHFTTIWNTKHGTVGQLLPNLECKVTDIDSGKTLSTGADGEICVRGPIVMKGYLNNPEATSYTIDNDGWLHTGDIGHYDINQNFYIVDRLKELIKYKGYQVPPAELEAILVSHPSIKDAAVIGVPDNEAGELPRAYVVSDGSLTENDVIKFVEEKVTPYKKLRGGVEFVESIPRSTSGKILRRELKEKLLEKSKKNTVSFNTTSDENMNRRAMMSKPRSSCCVII